MSKPFVKVAPKNGISIVALEKVLAELARDLSPEAKKGQTVVWMKRQADRPDPLLPSPPSILDRKGELNQWS